MVYLDSVLISSVKEKRQGGGVASFFCPEINNALLGWKKKKTHWNSLSCCVPICPETTECASLDCPEKHRCPQCGGPASLTSLSLSPSFFRDIVQQRIAASRWIILFVFKHFFFMKAHTHPHVSPLPVS